MIAFDFNYHNIPNSTIDERFKVKFKPISRQLFSWKEELIITAKTIQQTNKKPIYVLLSGGVDSEIVCRLFLELGINFKAITIKYKNKLNDYDVYFATKFCRENNIEQKIVELDAEHFFTKGFEQYINQGYRCTNLFFYQQLFLFEIVEELGGFGVSGEGDQSYYTINNTIHLKYNPNSKILFDWCENNKTEHQIQFNCSTPEIMASWMKIDLIDFLLQRPEYFINHYVDSTEKILIYHREWPEMQRRNKGTGFELMEHRIRKPIEHKLKLRFPDIENLYIPVKDIKQQLGI